MATEEKPALPPYPEMILAAIDSLNDKNGSNKSKISKHIESEYSDLPAGHSMLLSHHLNKMKDAGELVFAKNNYMRPDPNSPPNSPPKRGRGRPPKHKEPLPPGYVPPPPRPRGRPPKPKEPLPPGYVPPPPRPRGRPPKSKDPLAAAEAKAAEGLPKRRGRPPKKARPAGTSAPVTPGVKRGRGRPPKVKPSVAAVGA